MLLRKIPLTSLYLYHRKIIITMNMTILSNKNIDETIIAIDSLPKNHSTDRLLVVIHIQLDFIQTKVEHFTMKGYQVQNMQENGVKYRLHRLFHTTWYPTIGSNGVCSLKVNFGQEEFKYKEAND
ncbi:unnamed protein product [Rhizophagus irregularis]|nr:unnamed protein product [Rhizophagus irregularis]